MPHEILTALPIAALLDSDTIWILIPVLGIMIPIIAMLTNHQRKMAEIIHQNSAVPAADLEGIRQELREMRMLMNQHTIALDDMRTKQSTPTDVQQRLGSS